MGIFLPSDYVFLRLRPPPAPNLPKGRQHCARSLVPIMAVFVTGPERGASAESEVLIDQNYYTDAQTGFFALTIRIPRH